MFIRNRTRKRGERHESTKRFDRNRDEPKRVIHKHGLKAIRKSQAAKLQQSNGSKNESANF